MAGDAATAQPRAVTKSADMFYRRGRLRLERTLLLELADIALCCLGRWAPRNDGKPVRRDRRRRRQTENDEKVDYEEENQKEGENESNGKGGRGTQRTQKEEWQYQQEKMRKELMEDQEAMEQEIELYERGGKSKENMEAEQREPERTIKITNEQYYRILWVLPRYLEDQADIPEEVTEEDITAWFMEQIIDDIKTEEQLLSKDTCLGLSWIGSSR